MGMAGARSNLSMTARILLNVGAHVGNAVPAVAMNVVDRNGNTIW